MAIQTMKLDYGWILSLADMIARAREKPTELGRPTTPTAPSKEAPVSARAAAGPSYAEKVNLQLKEAAAIRREVKEAGLQRTHEVTLKQMELESKKATSLSEAMSKERIASIGMEAGIEQEQIAGAAQIGAAQKTTMEKGYELLDMLWKMDEPSRNEFISRLEAKRAETQAAGAEPGPPSTITMGGVTETLPGAMGGEPVRDPNDPLTALEEIGVYDSETGLSGPKLTGAAAKPEIDQYMELIDDMLDKNPMSIVAITTGKGWEELRETMRTIGMEAGFSEEVINSTIGMYEALVPEFEEPTDEGWSLGGAIKGALTPLGLGKEELPPEAAPGAEAYLGGAGAFEEGAAKVEKAPGFAKTLEEFIETIITGPFHPAYMKMKAKRAGKVTEVEEEAEGITEQEFKSQVSGWTKEQKEQLKSAAKAEGLSTWEYYNKHREEFKSE